MYSFDKITYLQAPKRFYSKVKRLKITNKRRLEHQISSFNSKQNINAQIKVFCVNFLSSGLRFASFWVFCFVENKPTLVHTLKSRISDPVIYSKTDEKFSAK